MAQISLEAYLAGVDAIQAETPTYQSGHDGSDGKCDCIGLTIGAIRRAGGTWTGIHGSNWAARNALSYLLPVSSANDLKTGEAVMKAARPGDSGYNLPDRYKNDPDQNDYYHWGVVRSVNPLRIVHCTSPGGVTVDTALGKWAYRGWLTQVSREETTGDDGTMATQATVTAESGSTVNLRKTQGGALLDRVPIGATVTVEQTGSEWSQITWMGKTGWMMTQFLQMDGAPAGQTGSADPDLAVRIASLETRMDNAEKRLAALDGGLG